jgi:hypothetical protein
MAVEQLNLFLIAKSNGSLPKEPHVELGSDLTFIYPWRSYGAQSVIKLKKDLDIHKLNKELKNSVFSGQKGSIAFKVNDIKIHPDGSMNVVITVKYSYLIELSKTYFAILPSELLPLIGSRLRNIEDIKSACNGFDICSRTSFWQQMFMHSFQEVYNGYVTLGKSEYMNENAYLAFSLFRLNVGNLIRGNESDNYLDYFGLLSNYTQDVRNLIKFDEQITMGNVILHVKHPRTYKAVNSDVFLKDNFKAIISILNFDVDVETLDENDDIYKVLVLNQFVNTQKVLDNLDNSEELYMEYYDNTIDYILYTYLLMLDFTGIAPTESNVKSAIIILDNIEALDGIFSEHYSEHLESWVDIFIPYLDKIKNENQVLYGAVIKELRTPGHNHINRRLLAAGLVPNFSDDDL